MEKAELFGYVVYANGDIYRDGVKVNYQKNIRVMWGNFSRFVSYARFVYYAFYRDFDFNNHSYCIMHKDETREDLNAIDNLYATNKKEYLKGGRHKMAKLNDRQIAEIKYLYKYGEDKTEDINSPRKKVSYRKLATMYGVNHNVIRRIVKEEEEK